MRKNLGQENNLSMTEIFFQLFNLYKIFASSMLEKVTTSTSLVFMLMGKLIC